MEETKKERLEFSLNKSLGVVKWIVASGTLTFFLTGITEVLGEFELPRWAVLLIYLVINTTLFAVVKFIEGNEKQD